MFWRKNPPKQFVRTKIELESALQVQLFKALKAFMPELSLQTIARLIVLAYWAAGFAEPSQNDGCFVIVYSTRRLTVRCVYDKLRYENLQRT